MRGAVLTVVILAAACGATSPPEDVCTVPLGGSIGSVEIGHGLGEYTPVVEGETFPVELGVQGLWMFVVSARATGMDISDGETAAVWYTASGPTGEVISVEMGCRARAFESAGEGSFEMTHAYFVPILPSYTSVLGGGTVTLQAIVRDASGHETTASVSVIAALPP